MANIIRLKHVNKTYVGLAGEAEVNAACDVCIEIHRNDYAAIIGKSGSGKSTLLNIIGGILRPDSGKVYVNDVDIYALKEKKLADFRLRQVGFVYQDFALIDELTVRENILFPYMAKKDKDKRRVMEYYGFLCERLMITEREGHYPNELSGGQKQRVAMARALINRPPLLLLDEPTGNLDSDTGNEVMDLIKQLHEEIDITVILVTHDMDLAQRCQYSIHIEDGHVV